MIHAASRSIVSAIVLREVYAETGQQDAKFIISPAVSTDIDEVGIDVSDSDGMPMEYSFRRWGTKLNLVFQIDGRTPDGMSIIDISMNVRSVGLVREKFSFWVIK